MQEGCRVFLLLFFPLSALLCYCELHFAVLCDEQEGVTSLAWLGSSRYVASGCIDGMVRIWDSLSGECARTLSGHGDVVQSLAIFADGNSIISGSSDGSARVFDISMFK